MPDVFFLGVVEHPWELVHADRSGHGTESRGIESRGLQGMTEPRLLSAFTKPLRKR